VIATQNPYPIGDNSLELAYGLGKYPLIVEEQSCEDARVWNDALRAS